MKRRSHTPARAIFCLLSVLILCGMILMPETNTPTLLRAEELSRIGKITPSARVAMADVPANAVVSVAQPPAPAGKEPPVAGDILALMYHDLTQNEARTSAWTTMPEKFRTDMTALLNAGYRPLSVEDYAAGNIRPGQDYFVITFDDGYTSNLTMALPILSELGIPATVFVITGSVGADGHMTWEQIEEITASGIVTVYSHTDTHMKASENTKETFLADESRAWAQIEDAISPSMKALAYPHGAYTRETMEALAAEGYEVFAIQDVPWWYTADNEAGVRILMRYNVAYESDILEIAEMNRHRVGLPTVEEASAFREAAAQEQAAATEAQRQVWIEHTRAYNRAKAEREGKGK